MTSQPYCFLSVVHLVSKESYLLNNSAFLNILLSQIFPKEIFQTLTISSYNLRSQLLQLPDKILQSINPSQQIPLDILSLSLSHSYKAFQGLLHSLHQYRLSSLQISIFLIQLQYIRIAGNLSRSYWGRQLQLTANLLQCLTIGSNQALVNLYGYGLIPQVLKTYVDIQLASGSIFLNLLGKLILKHIHAIWHMIIGFQKPLVYSLYFNMNLEISSFGIPGPKASHTFNHE